MIRRTVDDLMKESKERNLGGRIPYNYIQEVIDRNHIVSCLALDAMSVGLAAGYRMALHDMKKKKKKAVRK